MFSQSQSVLAHSQPPTQDTVTKFANRKAAFPEQLYEILEEPYEAGKDKPIRWSDDGKSFCVVDQERLRTEVFGRWFGHTKYPSFVRQLNNYGFQTISPLQRGALFRNQPNNQGEYQHEFFVRGKRGQLGNVQRKKNSKKGTVAGTWRPCSRPPATLTMTDPDPPALTTRAPSQHSAIEASLHAASEDLEKAATININEIMDTRQVLSVLSVVKGVQSVIRADLESLKQSNQDLWREAIVARENSQTQEHMLKQITKFLEHQYEPRRWGGIPEAVPRDINNRSSSPVPSTPRKRPRLLLGDSCDSVGHAGSASSERFQAVDTPGHRLHQQISAPALPVSTEARTPGPTLPTAESSGLIHYIPPSTTSNAEASLQQLLSNPEQYHALMRALAMHQPTAFAAAMPTSSLQLEPAENELQLSNRWDFSQIGHSVPTETSKNNNISATPVIPDSTSTNVSALAPQLVAYAQHIASTSKLGEKINQVDEMQTSLDEMMALIGVDPSDPFAGNPDTTMDDLNTQAQEDVDRGFASMVAPQSTFPTESLNFNPDTDWDAFLKFAMTDPNSFDANMGTNASDHILRDGAFLDEVTSQHSSDPTTSPAMPSQDLFGSENGDISMESPEPGAPDTIKSKRKTNPSQTGSKRSWRQPQSETSTRTSWRKQ